MRQRLVLVGVVGIGVLPAVAQVQGTGHPSVEIVQPSPSGDPIRPGPLVFDDSGVDLGKVFEDTKREFTLPFANRTERTVRITTLRASCGCTTPEADRPDRTYAAGESGELRVVFDPRTKSGLQNIQITVTTDDAPESQQIVNVRAVVLRRVDIEPAVVQFGQVQRGQTISKRVKVTAYADDYAADYVTVTTPGAVVAKILDTRETQIDGIAARETEIELTLHPGAARIGRLSGHTIVRTGHTRRLVQTAYQAEVVGDIRVLPQRPSLGLLEPGDPFRTVFTVNTRSGRPVNILEITQTSNYDDISFEWGPKPESEGAYEVRFVGNAPRGKPTRMVIRGSLFMTTDAADPAERVIEVPFYGTVKADPSLAASPGAVTRPPE